MTMAVDLSSVSRLLTGSTLQAGALGGSPLLAHLDSGYPTLCWFYWIQPSLCLKFSQLKPDIMGREGAEGPELRQARLQFVFAFE